jgi:hypothetical protein
MTLFFATYLVSYLTIVSIVLQIDPAFLVELKKVETNEEKRRLIF